MLEKNRFEIVKRIVAWTLVAAWMALIFYMSAQAADKSQDMSIGITERIIEEIVERLPAAKVDRLKLNHIVRKGAHFFLYFVLGLLAAGAVVPYEKPGFTSYGKSLGICVLYAVSDEIHQLFVPGRGGQLKDVGIDSAGALCGLLLYGALRWIWTFIKEKRAERIDVVKKQEESDGAKRISI